jgi:hypothetical protein
MSQGGHEPDGVPPPLPGGGWRTIGQSLLYGLLLWLGEAMIGVVPLGAHELVLRFSGDAGSSAEASLIPEVCILAVVISGLSVVSLLRFGPHGRGRQLDWPEYIMALASLVALIAGAVMYGLAAMKMNHGQTSLAVIALVGALFSSLAIALIGAVRR